MGEINAKKVLLNRPDHIIFSLERGVAIGLNCFCATTNDLGAFYET